MASLKASLKVRERYGSDTTEHAKKVTRERQTLPRLPLCPQNCMADGRRKTEFSRKGPKKK
jgi:hypothetical protein